MRLRFLVAGALALGSAPLQAAWHMASSTHFVIYADEDPATLKAFAQKLERFDKAVRVARNMTDPPVGDGNRLTVFVVRDTTAVRRLLPGNDSFVGAFYRAQASGSYAVVPETLKRRGLDLTDDLFFHEYAHHLMFQQLSTPIPPWLVEGFAEFMSTAEVNDDGSVALGAPVNARLNALSRRENPFPFTKMLAAAPPTTSEERTSLYARGWLLAHYLTFSPERRGQLAAYLQGIADGKAPLDAATGAFGDIAKLERDTQAYFTANKLSVLTLPAASLPIGEVSVAPLSPGAEAILPLAMRLRLKSDRDRAALAADIRKTAAAYPADPFVQTVLAEAELAAGQPGAAEAAADRAVAAQESPAAMIAKGRAILYQSERGVAGKTATAARAWFNKANRADPEDPEPLMMYFNSFASEKATPTANAIAALHYASDLAPQDMSLRLGSARAYLREGKVAEARRAAIPVAYNPHGGRLADEARALIAQLDSARGASTTGQ